MSINFSDMRNAVVAQRTRSEAVARISDRTASQQLANVVTWHLQLFSRYCALIRLGSRVWPFRVTWRHRFSVGHFLSVVHWNQASISNVFRDIQRRMWRNDWHDLNTTYNKGQCRLGHFGTNWFSHIRLQ